MMPPAAGESPQQPISTSRVPDASRSRDEPDDGCCKKDFVSFDPIFGDGRLNRFAWDCYVQISHAKSGDLGHPAGRRPSHQSWPLCVGHWEDAPPVTVDSPPLHPADRGPGPPQSSKTCDIASTSTLLLLPPPHHHHNNITRPPLLH